MRDSNECNKTKSRNKTHPDWKGYGINVFINRWYDCLENPVGPTKKKLPKLKFNKTAEHKISTWKAVLFWYTSNNQLKIAVKKPPLMLPSKNKK